jgi:hypothetical protein
VISDITRLGVMFLLAAVVPIWLVQPDVFERLTQTQAGIVGLVGGAGAGAAVYTIGESIWQLFFAHGRPGVRSLSGRPSSGLRAQMAAHHPEVVEAAAKITDDQGLVQELATSYTFHGRAPATLVEWARRRHARFRSALNEALALVLGLALSAFASPAWNEARSALTIALAAGAVILIRGAFEQRRQAEAMELLWHHMGDPMNADALLAKAGSAPIGVCADETAVP